MMDEERLAGYFESIYEALSVRGVPEDRLPTPWSVLSHVLDCVDYEALSEWIENFAALEAIEESEDESEGGDGSESPLVSKRRPAYLKAVSAPTPTDTDTDIEDEDT
jgi:hypothetical protein